MSQRFPKGTPPSSQYCSHKSLSRISAAAKKRRIDASPCVSFRLNRRSYSAVALWSSNLPAVRCLCSSIVHWLGVRLRLPHLNLSRTNVARLHDAHENLILHPPKGHYGHCFVFFSYVTPQDSEDSPNSPNSIRILNQDHLLHCNYTGKPLNLFPAPARNFQFPPERCD